MTSLGEDQDSHGLFKHVYSIHTYIHYITLIHTYIHTLHTYITYIHTYVRTYIHTYTHTYTHIYMYIHICVYVILCDYMCVSVYLYIVYMGVGQNKGITGSYNRPSTANQPRSQRCQSREGSVVCDTILRRESSKHCYISQYLETWREPGPTQAGLTIADQPRTNRGFHRDYLKIELI